MFDERIKNVCCPETFNIFSLLVPDLISICFHLKYCLELLTPFYLYGIKKRKKSASRVMREKEKEDMEKGLF
jgi:hypothetical protein